MVFAVADIILLWPIWLWQMWSVADMVAPRFSRMLQGMKELEYPERLKGKSTQFEQPGKFMKVSYNDSLSD